MGDLSSVTVRLGHILQGSKAMTALLNASDEVIDESFEFRLAHDPPADFREWALDADWILDSSKAAGDLSDADRAAIREHDNGDWLSPRFVHWCLPDCHLCRRDEAQSKEHMKQLGRTSLSPGCPVALLYRWKRVGEAQAYAIRGRGQHELLPRSLQRVWSKKALVEATLAAEMANDVTEFSFSTQAAANAASVLRLSDNDKRGNLFLHATDT